MKIVVEGHTIDTLEIFDIVDLSSGRLAGFKIKLIDKPSIKITKDIPYERTPSQIHAEHRPYDNLRKEIIKQWEADKTELKIFKL